MGPALEPPYPIPAADWSELYELQAISDTLQPSQSHPSSRYHYDTTADEDHRVTSRQLTSINQADDEPDPALEPLPVSLPASLIDAPGSSLQATEHYLQDAFCSRIQDGDDGHAYNPGSQEPSTRDATKVPLPPSIVASANSSLMEVASRSVLEPATEAIHIVPRLPKYLRYPSRMPALSEYFPQLRQVVSMGGRHNPARVTVLGYSGYNLCGIEDLSSELGDWKVLPSKLKEIRERLFAKTVGPEIDTKLVIIEDVGPSMIGLFSTIFDISPEFFAEHLYRSGYSTSKEHDPAPQTWNTSGLGKNYISMEWYRPVDRWRQEPDTELQRKLLLETAAELQGTYQVKVQSRNKTVSKRVTYTIKTTTNIFRPECAMSTDPDGFIAEISPAAWEERATACRVESAHCQYLILLLDPVPLLKKKLYGHRRALGHEIVDLKGPRREKSNCQSRTAPDSTFGGNPYQYELLSPFTQARPRTPWTLNYSNLFSNDIVQELDHQLYPFQSTKDAFERWLLSAGPDHVASYANCLGPASMIFRIAYQDTLGLLQIMRVAITEISRASSNNVLQERALHWRYRLDQFRAQLMELQESLQQFADYVHHPAFPYPNCHGLEKSPIECLHSDALNQISVLKSRIEQAYASLTSKVQISDSHRSIAEAETVTRLTELAFLFIPLSFATSIFGMQIINNATPFSIYIAVALALTSVVLRKTKTRILNPYNSFLSVAALAFNRVYDTLLEVIPAWSDHVGYGGTTAANTVGKEA